MLDFETTITPTGRLSLREAIKSLRDIAVVALGALVPQMLEILVQVEWGAAELPASIILGALAPLLNRLLNGWRVE